MKVYLGMSWKEVKEILGDPDDYAIFRKGAIYKYYDIEFHFTNRFESGILYLIYSEAKDGTPTTWGMI
jgi:hypothetical protein